MASKNNFFNLYLKVNDKEAKTTLKNVGDDLRTLRSYTRNLEEGTEKWHKANEKLAEVEKTYDQMKRRQRDFITETKNATEATEDQTSAIQDFSDNASQAFSSLMSGDLIGFQEGMKGVQAGLMGATKAAWAFLATPVGVGIAALAGIALATKEWFDYNKEAAEANLMTQQLTRLSGEALDQARVRATAIEKTFGIEFRQSLESARSLVQAFGISYEEAFDRIEDGLIRGGKENDDFLDSIKEYPKLFSQAGFTAEEFQRILNTGIDMSIYSDKLPDAIKEFSLSIMEETTASRDALENAFGKAFTDELFTNIQNGSITSKDALQLVAAEAQNIGLNAQQAQQLTADLFRGAGEDAGGALVIFEAVNVALNEQARALTPLEEQLNKVANANKRLEQAQNDALKSDQYVAFMNDIEVAWINFKAGFFEGVNAISEGLVDVDRGFRKFVFTTVQTVKNAFLTPANAIAEWKMAAAAFDREEEKRLEAARQRREQERKEREEELKNQQSSNADFTPSYNSSRSGSPSPEKEKDVDQEAAKRAEKEKAIRTKVEEQLKEWENERAIKEQLEKFEKDQKAEEEEILRLEQKFEKLEEDAAGEKELLARLEEEKELQIQEIRDKYSEEQLKKKQEENKKLLEQEKKFKAELIAAEENLQRAKEGALDTGIGALKGFFGEASGIYKMLLGLEKSMAVNEIIVNAASSIAQAKANLAAVPPFIGTLPNPVYALAAAATAKNILATKISAGTQIASIAAATLQGFDKGGFTDLFGMGYRDSSGKEVAGVVHTEEYVVPEFVRQDPEVPPILDYLEAKRKKKLGLYADGGDTSSEITGRSEGVIVSQASRSSKVEDLLQDLIEITSATRDNYFGIDAEIKRQEAEQKIKKIRERSKIKKE